MTGAGTPVVSPYVVSFDIAEEYASLTVDDATACTALDNPHVAVKLGNGSVRLVPLPCIDLSDIALSGNAFAFTRSGTTTDADPGDGTLRLNNATPASITALYVDDQEIGGTNIVSWLQSFSAGSHIRLYSRSAPTNWIDLIYTGYTDHTGYTTVAVTYVDHSGTLTNTVGDTVLDFVAGGAPGAAGATGATGGFNSIQTIEAITGPYTLVLADVGKHKRASNVSAFTITVPLNSSVAFSIGSHIDFVQSGVGQVSFAGAVGVTVNAAPGLKLNGQWAGATLVKVGTNEWDLVGNLTS